jgi:hypothetical protein
MDQVVVTFADGRAEMVSGLYCSGHPSARARLALALRYAPPDARAHGTARGDLGRAPLYVSHQLARALPPALFTDCDGNPAPRGSFVVDVHDIDGTPQWQLTPGACDS